MSAIILATGFLIDRNAGLQEKLRVQQAVRHAAQMTERSLAEHFDNNVDLINAIADDIADDAMLSPAELNRTIANTLALNPQFVSIRFKPLADQSRMAFTPRITSEDARIFVDIPIPPMPWGAPKLWQSMVTEIDKAALLQSANITDFGMGENHLVDGHLTLAVVHNGKVLLGEPDILSHDPERLDITIAGGQFELYAVPQMGWDAAMSRSPVGRLLLLAGILTMMIAAFGAIYLLRERNINLARLAAREARLDEVSKRLRMALETSRTGIWQIDASTRQLIWDERASLLHGQASDGPPLLDRIEDWYASIHPEDLDRAEKVFFDFVVANTQEQLDFSYRVVLPSGAIRHLRSVGAHSETGLLTGIVCDVTSEALINQRLSKDKEDSDIKNAELELALEELSSREHQLIELSQRLDMALGSYKCGTWEGDPATKMATWDERMHQLYGLPYSEQPVTEQQWLNAIHPDDRSLVVLASKRASNLGQPMHATQRVLLPNDEIRFIRSVGQSHVGRDGRKKLIGIAFDVTADVMLAEQLRAAKAEADTRNIELELAKNRIEYNALHDPLTSLANRRKFDQALDALRKSGSRAKYAILHLDLDRFKEINDTLGHAAGDAMLVHASRVLNRIVQRGDLVARIGGDEFVILSHTATSHKDLSRLAGQIVEEMHQPIDFEGFSCRCGVSIGIAQASGMSSDPHKILINADIALYQAKEKGRNGFAFFTPDLQANIIAKKRMADDILNGLERDEFTVHYQPQFHATTMQMCGAEALVRWRHPQRGIVATHDFLRVAEDLNVMARIDQIVLQTALKDQMRWTALGFKTPKISVNVSSKRLHDVTLIAQLKQLSLMPDTICFELVESIFLDDSHGVSVDNVGKIKTLGIDIEIDDFGTGHTSIVSLLKLKPKRLKIDRQLVMPITSQPQERNMVRSIVEIARSLGIETVAEGVETKEHATILREIGCDYLQGYYYAKPLSFDDFTRFMSKLPQRIAS